MKQIRTITAGLLFIIAPTIFNCDSTSTELEDPVEIAGLLPVYRLLTFSLYDFRYCEVLLETNESGQTRADVYFTGGPGTCPADLWENLDSAAIASAHGVDSARLNGPRFWVLDRITNNDPTAGSGPVADFGGITMRRVADVLLPANSAAYQISRVSRNTVFHFLAGRPIHELHDPLGRVFVMQSYSHIHDQDLTIGNLATLESRLTLPSGWSFHTRILEADFDLRVVDGVAEVVQDNLENSYQRRP